MACTNSHTHTHVRTLRGKYAQAAISRQQQPMCFIRAQSSNAASKQTVSMKLLSVSKPSSSQWSSARTVRNTKQLVKTRKVFPFFSLPTTLSQRHIVVWLCALIITWKMHTVFFFLLLFFRFAYSRFSLLSAARPTRLPRGFLPTMLSLTASPNKK